ncbi:histone-lysine N-methyltransferase SETMAR-like [Augochlora pura]
MFQKQKKEDNKFNVQVLWSCFTFWRLFSFVSSKIETLSNHQRKCSAVVENVDKITEIIAVVRHISSRSIARELKFNHETVLNHLHKTVFKKKLDVWVPHQLAQKNHTAAAGQIVVKPELTAKKVLLCIWRDWKEIIYYELLSYGQTLNADLCCQQLDRLRLAIDQKWPELANRRGVVCHQDNVRPQRLS